MIFAFFHELSHVIVGLILKFKLCAFEIKPVGFSVSFFNPIDDYNKKIINGNLLELKKIVVYMAGPILNLLLAIMLNLFSVKSELIYVNIALFVFNLVPIYPLDGGRIIKSILYIFCGLKRAYRIMKNISFVFVIIVLFMGSLMIIKYQNIGVFFSIIYVSYISFISLRAFQKNIEVYEIIEKYSDRAKR